LGFKADPRTAGLTDLINHIDLSLLNPGAVFVVILLTK